jgi:endonuclease YncB( thermonuclease family)
MVIGRRLLAFGVVIVACLISLAGTTRHSSGDREPAERRETVVGRVVSVADGDTLTVLDSQDRQHRIRLYGIDAPEKAQPFGSQAKKSLSGKVFGATVRVDVVDVDRYGRQVGRVYFGNRLINLEQVREGYAWRYTQFDRHHEFDRAEAEARRSRRGLWSAPHPIPPWEFRREQRVEG